MDVDFTSAARMTGPNDRFLVVENYVDARTVNNIQVTGIEGGFMMGKIEPHLHTVSSLKTKKQPDREVYWREKIILVNIKSFKPVYFVR